MEVLCLTNILSMSSPVQVCDCIFSTVFFDKQFFFYLDAILFVDFNFTLSIIFILPEQSLPVPISKTIFGASPGGSVMSLSLL